jgi:hypothetical protein
VEDEVFLKIVGGGLFENEVPNSIDFVAADDLFLLFAEVLLLFVYCLFVLGSVLFGLVCAL